MKALQDLLASIAVNPWGHGLIYAAVFITVLMTIAAWVTWWERKFSARMQNRLGPTIVGKFGLLQPIADSVKMMHKELVVPRAADRFLFLLAPPLTMFLTLAIAAVVPFGPSALASDLDIGVLWILAFSGLMVFPLWIAGWSSNNKYALLGSMRAVAQGLSYEIPMVLCAMVPVILAGSMSVSDIVKYQVAHHWFIYWPTLPGFAAFVLFFVASLAEANRIPFDIPEAESELISGFTVEYSGMFYGMFAASEYVHTMITSAIASALFLGGWDGPFGSDGLVWMILKTLVLFLLVYWLRWTLVRFRSDQLMKYCWTWLVPISLGLVALSALWVEFGPKGAPV